MKQSITTLLLIYHILFIDHSYAQSSDIELSKKYTVEELNEDFGILRESLEKSHSGLYAYTSKEEMDEAFDKLSAELNEPMTSIEFYRKILPLNRLIKNNHTKFSPSENYENAVKESLLRFPFEVYWDNNKLFVLQNNSMDEKIEEGSIIENINGEQANDVFKELVDNSRRDGYNKTGVEAEIEGSFSKFYAYFKDTPASYQLKLITPDGTIKDIVVKAITLEKIKENKFKRYKDDGNTWIEKKEPVLQLNIDKDIAILKLRLFMNPYNDKQKLQDMFNNAFTTIKRANVKHLIIDIRDNRGGNEYRLMDLFSHLYDKPFTLYEEKHTVFKRIINSKFYTENLAFKNLCLPLTLTKKEDGYSVKKFPNLNGYPAGLKEKKPSEVVYDDDIYLLTNGISFSASGFCAGLLKGYNRATIIGEETGGNASQCTAGEVIILKLPHTNIKVNMPLLFLKLNVNFENTGHGAIPDYEIRPGINDLLLGKDVVMEFTLKLIEGRKGLSLK